MFVLDEAQPGTGDQGMAQVLRRARQQTMPEVVELVEDEALVVRKLGVVLDLGEPALPEARRRVVSRRPCWHLKASVASPGIDLDAVLAKEGQEAAVAQGPVAVGGVQEPLVAV